MNVFTTILQNDFKQSKCMFTKDVCYEHIKGDLNLDSFYNSLLHDFSKAKTWQEEKRQGHKLQIGTEY